jgi:hypothetical protein
MSWIALRMLVGDRAKHFGIVFGVTFAALLRTQQASIFWGLMTKHHQPDPRPGGGGHLGHGPQRPLRQ